MSLSTTQYPITAPPTTTADRPMPNRARYSLVNLASEITDDAKTLITAHGELLTAELNEKQQQATRNLIFMAMGVVGLAVGILFVMVGLVYLTLWLFPTLMPWAAWLIWGAISLTVGGLVSMSAIKSLSFDNLLPHRTIHSLKETWACVTNLRNN